MIPAFHDYYLEPKIMNNKIMLENLSSCTKSSLHLKVQIFLIRWKKVIQLDLLSNQGGNILRHD